MQKDYKKIRKTIRDNEEIKPQMIEGKTNGEVEEHLKQNVNENKKFQKGTAHLVE